MRGEKANREAGRKEGCGEKAALESRPPEVVLLQVTLKCQRWLWRKEGMDQGALDMSKEPFQDV